MRPVDRGTAPGKYTGYQDAGPDLQGRLGAYCSYCERRIETNLAVEHIQPKSLVPELETSWNNFLLACVNCNSAKGNTSIILTDYFWPDVDNTLRALEYSEGGLVQPRANLVNHNRTKAQNTIELTGLDKYPGNLGREPTTSDQRWLRRYKIWRKAKEARADLAKQNTDLTRKHIVEIAVAWGIFSIWWTVFANDVDMRRRLREAFTGTDDKSFDKNENLVPRPGGQL